MDCNPTVTWQQGVHSGSILRGVISWLELTYKSLRKHTQPPPHRQERSVENEGFRWFQLHVVSSILFTELGGHLLGLFGGTCSEAQSEFLQRRGPETDPEAIGSFWIRLKDSAGQHEIEFQAQELIWGNFTLKEWSWHELAQSMSRTFSVARTCLIAFQACKKPWTNRGNQAVSHCVTSVGSRISYWHVCLVWHVRKMRKIICYCALHGMHSKPGILGSFTLNTCTNVVFWGGDFEERIWDDLSMCTSIQRLRLRYSQQSVGDHGWVMGHMSLLATMDALFFQYLVKSTWFKLTARTVFSTIEHVPLLSTVAKNASWLMSIHGKAPFGSVKILVGCLN